MSTESPKIKVTGTVVQGEETETGLEGGTVVLQQAENISGATVTATNLDSGALLASTTSDSNGDFSLEFTLVSYALTAKKNGVEYATDNVQEEAVGGDSIIIESD